MKRLYNKLLVLTLFAGVIALGNSSLNDVKAQERDPFSPSAVSKVESKSEKSSKSKIINQLTSSKLSTYKVIGVIVSEDRKIAAIKALNGSDYLVSKGDRLGSEGGIITDIDIEGIAVELKTGEVQIPVSNKINKVNDKKD